MSIDDKVCFDYWENAPSEFIADDRLNPARAAAATIVQALAVEHIGITLAEVGPGPGFDYLDHFRSMPAVRFTAVECCKAVAVRLREHNANVRLGGFDLLSDGAETFDVVYTKATLEHQPDWLDPLAAMIAAARRLVIVNFYLPPIDQPALLRYSAEQQMHYNHYDARRIAAYISDRRRTLAVVAVPGSTNVLYLIGGRP